MILRFQGSSVGSVQWGLGFSPPFSCRGSFSVGWYWGAVVPWRWGQSRSSFSTHIACLKIVAQPNGVNVVMRSYSFLPAKEQRQRD